MIQEDRPPRVLLAWEPGTATNPETVREEIDEGKGCEDVGGLLRARLPEVVLDEVPDPRAREARWSLAQILRAALVGIMAGCRSMSETEALTEGLAPAVRRRLGLPRRLSDTTARDTLCRVPLDGLRAALHRLVRAAWRRKALRPVGLPVSVLALDGKSTALPTLNHPLVQNHIEGPAVPFGLVRTVTCSHAKAFLSVEYVKVQRGVIVEQDERTFVSSYDPKRLTPARWLRLVRSHWAVESSHHTLDTAFAEDDRPWIEVDPHRMLAVLLLRRIAYTLLALYRAVTLRSDEGRATRWKTLLLSVRDVLVAATEEQRLREIAAATR